MELISKGQRIGRWTVVSIQGARAVVLCKCGTKRIVYTADLRLAKTGGCRKCSQLKYRKTAESLVGKVIGGFKVISTEKIKDNYKYHIKCNCGVERTVARQQLLSNKYGCYSCRAKIYHDERARILTEKFDADIKEFKERSIFRRFIDYIIYTFTGRNK